MPPKEKKNSKKTSSAETKGQSGRDVKVTVKMGPPVPDWKTDCPSSLKTTNSRQVRQSKESSIPDSITNNLDSGLQLWLDSGFQSHGFRIPQTKITWIPDYLTWGEQIMDKLLMLS